MLTKNTFFTETNSEYIDIDEYLLQKLKSRTGIDKDLLPIKPPLFKTYNYKNMDDIEIFKEKILTFLLNKNIELISEQFTTPSHDTFINEEIENVLDTISDILETGEYIMKEKIIKLYKLEDKNKIFEFLSQNRFMYNFLIEARQEIEKVFGENVSIYLTLVEEPEIFGGKGLFAYIYTDLSVEDALRKIEILDENWFLNNLDKARGRFNFDVEWA